MSKVSDRNYIKSLALKHGFSLKHTNEQGEPDLKPYVYGFAEDLQKSTYQLIPLGLGKVTLFLSKYPSDPALYISHRSTGQPLGAEVPSSTWYPDEKLPAEDIAVCLRFANTQGIDNLVEELQKLKYQMLNGEFNETDINN